ncbi:MAG: CHAD domain-containing protein [Candidatus Binatia bacterium]
MSPARKTPPDGPLSAKPEATVLIGPAPALQRITRFTALGPYPLRRRDTTRGHAVYLDTPQLALAHHGVALCLRRQARVWDAIATWADRTTATGREPAELTVPLAGTPHMPFVLPDGPLRVHLGALAAGRPLAPILIIDRHRRVWNVLPPGTPEDAPPIAELALSRVHLRATPGTDGGPADAISLELEIERRSRSWRDVARLVQLLEQNLTLTPPTDSAFARGLALFHGPVSIIGSEPVLPVDTVETATRKIIGLHLRRLCQHDPGVRLGRDPEALHNLRVAVRRLRAAVRAFGAGIPSRLRTSLGKELQWLGQLTGGVRDLDVQLARLHHHSAMLPASHRAGLTHLREYMETERAQRRTTLLAGMNSRRYFRLLTRLEDFALGHSPQPARNAAAREPIASAARREIKRAFRRLRKRGDTIEGAPSSEDLHTLRIRAKRVRYLLEFLQAVTGRQGRRWVRRLTRLQDLLGAYHDAVVAADFVRQYAEGPGAELGAAGMLTLGSLVSSALHAAEERRDAFQRTWRRFTRKRALGDFRAVLYHLRGLEPDLSRPLSMHGATPIVEAVGDVSLPHPGTEPPPSGEST